MAYLEENPTPTGQRRRLAAVQQSIKQQSLFTLHTPVPAGNEVFDVGIASRYLDPLRQKMGMSEAELAELGSSNGDHSQFDLGRWASGCRAVVNGVSKRHAEMPPAIGSVSSAAQPAVTNGVHTPTWIGRDGGEVLTNSLGRNWPTVLLEDPEAVEQITSSPCPTSGRCTRRERRSSSTSPGDGSVASSPATEPRRRNYVRSTLPSGRSPDSWLRPKVRHVQAGDVDVHRSRPPRSAGHQPGSARADRFRRQGPPGRPPRPGLHQANRGTISDPELQGHIFMLEDYNARTARFMVQGVDVWLNNPRPPMEASGTSGIKAAINGTLNLSVLDGWWSRDTTAATAGHSVHPKAGDDYNAEDNDDSAAFYKLMESEIVPCITNGTRRAGSAMDRDDARVDHVDHGCLLDPPNGGRLCPPGLLPDGR